MRKTKTTEEEKKMKKTKKTNCKCTPNWNSYTPGKNAFGEDAYTELIVVKRETALEQILAAIRTFDGTTKEFTFDFSCFAGHMEELDAIMEKVNAIMMIRASLARKSFAAF